ncbi:MAG: hypothetical protein AAGE96_01705 [Cyanobacteria bacterium P01_G01_bin.19]
MKISYRTDLTEEQWELLRQLKRHDWIYTHRDFLLRGNFQFRLLSARK